MSSLQKIIQLCEKHFFLKPNPPDASRCNVYGYDFGPPGELLRNNIYQEWIFSNIINTDDSCFPFSYPCRPAETLKDVKDQFLHAKELCCSKLPFGICGRTEEAFGSEGDSLLSTVKSFEAGSCFLPRKYTTLRVFLFSYPDKSAQIFNLWQRQRKSWWRKFSGSPGRYTLTDVKSLAVGDTVMINAEYPWGKEHLEVICHRGCKPLETVDDTTRAQFEIKDGRRHVLPHIIESVTTLDGAMLAFLCDAYKERTAASNAKISDSNEKDLMRYTLHLHHRLAPYKASFSASSSNSPLTADLQDLAFYLTRQLRRAHIPVLLLPDLLKKSLENQYIRNDEMGIPYTLVINETTLKNGIIGLRSRDTTLKEQLHITDLKSHMRLLLKNY